MGFDKEIINNHSQYGVSMKIISTMLLAVAFLFPSVADAKKITLHKDNTLFLGDAVTPQSTARVVQKAKELGCEAEVKRCSLSRSR